MYVKPVMLQSSSKILTVADTKSEYWCGLSAGGGEEGFGDMLVEWTDT